jgi:hypothetical protein
VRGWYTPVPTKSRPEDVFIEAFLSAYEDLTWADADKDWLDRRIDGAVEMLATRKSDRKTLAIEHTVIEPFVKDKEDFAFFEQAFLKIQDDDSLVVPDRWIRVFIPVGTLHGHRKAAAREAIVEVVHHWIRANRLSLKDGEHDYPCAVTGIPGTTDFEIKLTINATLAKHGQLNLWRQQVGNDFGDVVKKALRNKLPKLTKQKADKRILVLERQHWNLYPEQILDEVAKQGVAFPAVDEIWILETPFYKPGGYFQFVLLQGGKHVAGLTFNGGACTGRSKDGMPIPM